MIKNIALSLTQRQGLTNYKSKTMKNKITLSGFAGSGKSTIGKIIGEQLNFEFISVGNYSRAFAKREFGLSINQFQEKRKEIPNIDKVIDEQFKKECNSKNNIIVDYRLGFNFIQNALHVLLKVSDEQASLRINSAKRKGELTNSEAIKERNQVMRMRFKETYNVDFTNEDNYDLVIETDDLTTNEVANIILNFYKKNAKISYLEKIPSINFHLWEPCNMRCEFCFATFQDVKQSILPKGHLPEQDALMVVREIAAAGFQKITFAGGEPLLCKWLPNLIKEAKQLGLTTMIVTNGSKLTNNFLEINKPYLDWIAISIDSLIEENNIKIGRAITGKTPLNKQKYYDLVATVKQYGYGLKINTVVNKVNFEESFIEFIEYAKPKRWKVLQVLPMIGQNDKEIDNYKITDSEFNHFKKRHQSIKTLIPESNNAIKGSYVMVDPAGRFFDNSTGTHNYSKPILEVGAQEAIKTMNYNLVKFKDRGGYYNWNL